MGILFVVALLLAFPTFGLSLVAWFALFVIRAKASATRVRKREKVKTTIEPLFDDRFDDFFLSLDMPFHSSAEMSEADAHQCGRHIMNYVAHNPSEAALFLKGIENYSFGHPCHPGLAALCERESGGKGEIHAVSYRAVEALMTNNKLKCFQNVDLAAVMEKSLTANVDALRAQRGLEPIRNSCALSASDEIHIEMAIVQFVRSGRERRHRYDIDFAKLEAYARSRGGTVGFRSAAVDLLVLDKLYRLHFQKGDGALVWLRSTAADASRPVPEGVHNIAFGKSYEADKQFLAPRVEPPDPSSAATSGAEKDEDEEPFLEPAELVSSMYYMTKSYLGGDKLGSAKRPAWGEYEEELGHYCREVCRHAGALGVHPAFAEKFVGDDAGLNFIMFPVCSADSNGRDISYLKEVGAYAVKFVWDRPDERRKFIEKWEIAEQLTGRT